MAAIAAGPCFRCSARRISVDPTTIAPRRCLRVNVGLLDGQLAWRQHDGGHTDGPNWKLLHSLGGSTAEAQTVLAPRDHHGDCGLSPWIQSAHGTQSQSQGLPPRYRAAAFVSSRIPGEPPTVSTTFEQSNAATAGMDGWFDRPMRWVQLTLVENDPGRFDAQFWLDYFRRLHADAATLSAGGIVAYYPTEVPLHHRSAWLGDSDPFGTLVAGVPRARHAGRRAHRSARRPRRGARRPPRLDLDDARRRAAAALGESRSLGDLRARAVQLRLHGPRPSRDRVEVQG
jgi:hypothetical protein